MRSVRSTALAATCAALALAPAAKAQAPVEALLLEVEGETVKLNRGRDHGVRAGQVFDVYRDARVYVLPLTRGEVPLVRSQRRVGQVLVFDAEPSTARASVIRKPDLGGDGDAKPEVLERGLRALLNPVAVAPNRPVEFLRTPQPAAAPWRARVELRLEVSNEPDDGVVYTWSVTGGALEHARTLLPQNGWLAPPEAGTYRVSVEARDTSGNVTRVAFNIEGAGLAGARPLGPLRTTSRSFGAAPRYARTRDVAFDWLRTRPSRRFVLDLGRGGVFSSGDPTLAVEAPELAPGWQARVPLEDYDFLAVAVSNPTPSGPGALYALDGRSRTVLRFGFGGEWAQVVKRAPTVFGEPEGGAGNARFVEPVDLALSAQGEVYVLDAGQRAVQVFGPQGAFLVSFGRPGTKELELDRPRALAVGPDGAVYVLDDGRKSVVVYRGWRAQAEFSAGGPEEELVGIAVDPYTSDVYVLERAAGAVKRFSAAGQLLGRFAGEPGALEALSRPVRLRMDPTRVLWVIDREGDSIVRLDETTAFLGRTGGEELSGPLKVAGLPDGGVVALDRGGYKVVRFDPQGWITARFGRRGDKPGELTQPIDVAASRSGDVFVLDASRRRLVKFSPGGAFLEEVGQPGEGQNELGHVVDLSTTNDRAYLVVVQQRAEHNFNLVDPRTGESVRTWGALVDDQTPRAGCVIGVEGRLDGGGSSKPWFWSSDDDREQILRGQWPQWTVEPLGEAFDDVADMEPLPTGHVVVVDVGAQRVVVLGPDGQVASALPADERMKSPQDVGVDDFGRVWVWDRALQRIVELTD